MGDPFRFDLIPPGSGVLCALSGGADSMYLLCRLLEGGKKYGWGLQAAHLNHGLRDAAGRDEDFVREWCGQLGVSLTVGQADVPAFARREGLSAEEAGRVLRYAFLEETARQEGLSLVATGHHAGDNAETVLMNLIRGCGLKGLTGIPERRGNIIRPMLAVTRQEIETYLEEHSVPHVEDETNTVLAYTRNRVRHQLLPLLEELNPRAAVHIAAAASRLGEDEALLSSQAGLLVRQGLDVPGGVAVNIQTLQEAPRPLALRACAALLDKAGLGGEAVHLDAVLALAAEDDPSAQVDVPGGSVRRQYGLLVFSSAAGAGALLPMELAEGENRWGEWIILCTRGTCPAKAYVSPWEFYLKPGRYVIRPRRAGDRLTLGSRPVKTVKKLMIEGRVPAHGRERVPVLDTGGQAAAVGGFGPDRGYLAEPRGLALHIMIKIEENESCTKT